MCLLVDSDMTMVISKGHGAPDLCATPLNTVIGNPLFNAAVLSTDLQEALSVCRAQLISQ